MSQQTTATLTTFNEVDMSKVIEIRAKYKDKFAHEIQKAEERVSKVLADEEEKRAQERISMLEELKMKRAFGDVYDTYRR